MNSKRMTREMNGHTKKMKTASVRLNSASSASSLTFIMIFKNSEMGSMIPKDPKI